MKTTKKNSERVATNKSTKPAEAKAAEVTPDSIQKYLDLREERLELQRKAAKLAVIEDKMAEVIRANVENRVARNVNKVTRIGRFVLSLVPRGIYPSWKAEFIRVAGEEAAEQVRLSTPPRIELEIVEDK